MYQLQLPSLLRQASKFRLLFCVIMGSFLLLSSSTFAQHPPQPYPEDKELTAPQTEEVGEYWKNLSDDIEKKEGGEQAGPSQLKSAQEFDKAQKKYGDERNAQKARENKQKAADQYRRAGENMKNSDPAKAAKAFERASVLYGILFSHCQNDRNKNEQAQQFKRLKEDMQKKAQDTKKKAEQKNKDEEVNNQNKPTPRNANERKSRGRGRNQANQPPKRKLVRIAILVGKGLVKSDEENPELRSWSGPFLKQAIKKAVTLKAENTNRPINVDAQTSVLLEKVKSGEIVRILVKMPKVDYLYSFYPRSIQFKQAFGENDIILFMGHAQGNHGSLLAGMNSDDKPLDVSTLPSAIVKDKTIILFRCYSSNAAKALAGKGGKAWGTSTPDKCVPLPITGFTDYLSNMLENISKGMSRQEVIDDANKTLKELKDRMTDSDTAESSGLITPAHK